MELQNDKLALFLRAKEEWAVLDEDGDIIGIKDGAPVWAKDAIRSELDLMHSAEPIER